MEILGMIGAGFVLIGGCIGAYAASTGYWTEKVRVEVEKRLTTPKGNTFAEREEDRGRAHAQIEEKKSILDNAARNGWAFVIVGSGFLFGSELVAFLAGN